MGISRDSRHKRRPTGGKRAIHQKKRKFELGRQPANTKLGGNKVNLVRTRGGNRKFRALRLDHGAFSWSSEQCTHKSKIVAVVFNPTSNDLVRTNTITRNTIVTIDASPFKNWYHSQYGVDLGKKKVLLDEAGNPIEPPQPSEEQKAQWAKRAEQAKLEPHLEEQFNAGRLFACISSRPGQIGKADGYILEGKELEFYKRKMDKKRK